MFCISLEGIFCPFCKLQSYLSLYSNSSSYFQNPLAPIHLLQPRCHSVEVLGRTGHFPLIRCVPKKPGHCSVNNTLLIIITVRAAWNWAGGYITSIFILAFHVFQYGKWGPGYYPAELLVGSVEIALWCVRIKQAIRNQTSPHQGGKKSVDNIVNQPQDKCLPGWSPTIYWHWFLKA